MITLVLVLRHLIENHYNLLTSYFIRSRYSIFVRSVPNLSSESVFGKLELDLADNKWHQIHIMRGNSTTLTLYIDIDQYSINVPGFYSKRYTHQMFYLGGVGNSYAQSRHPLFRTNTLLRFEGCFENEYVKVNGLMLLDLARRGNATVHGKKISRCNTTPGSYSPITFLKPESFIKITAPNKNTAKYSFKFRTYSSEGVLLFQRITKTNGADIFISLDSGKIKVDVRFASKSTPVTLIGGLALDDGMWHQVAVNISIQNVRLEVDSELISQSQRSLGTFVSSSEVFVGASDKERPGFIGCMRDLTVQGRKINFTTVSYKSQVKISDCFLRDLCVPSPCQNGGRCSQSWNQTFCHCSETDFEGVDCASPTFFMQTCADWWAAGKTSNGYYKINPRNSDAFLVYCNMTNVDGPSTVIFHTQDRKPIIAAQNKVEDKSYRHEISYENSNKQNIGDLIATSTHCRQYLEYNCYNSVLFDSPKSFNLESGRGARWVSHDGKTQDYWSGASRGSMKCACGMNRTCVESSKVCNCDTVNNIWHADGGYLTDSRSLPVKTLIFSVDGTSVRSNYVLGSLECYGSKTNRTSTTSSPVTETLTTSTKSPSTKSTMTTSGKQTVSTQDGTSTSTQPSGNGRSTAKPSSSSETHTQVKSTVQPTNTSDPPGIIVIESPRKYITIRENANQELVLIILSVILAVFVIAIVVLLIKQNLFFPCKCLQAPLYHDVSHMDTIELGPPSPMYRESEPEPILQLEASPYPARNFDIGMHDCHISSSPELYSDAETDRLDISIGSSSWISENAEMDKDVPEKPIEYEDLDLGLIDVVPTFPTSKQLSTEQQIRKLKEVIFDVLSASGDVRANYSDKRESHICATKQARTPRIITRSESVKEVDQSQLAANEQFVDSDNDSTATISELDSDHELFVGDQCAEEENTETEACDESSKENTLKTCETAGSKEIIRNNWRSSDPHDNYLSLDVNQLEHDAGQTQPYSGVNMNGHSYNGQITGDKDIRYATKEKQLSPKCDGRNREDKRKHSSPRALLFSRQKSEEEALLSSTQASGLGRTSRFSDSNQRRYSGISNASCGQRHQQQSASPRKNQSENQFRDRNKVSAKAIPLRQSHSQKYETEL